MDPLKPKKPTSSKAPPRKPARRPPPVIPAPSVPDDLHARIEVRAREIYEHRTRQGALDDWLQAEREVLSKPGTKPKRPSL